MVAVLGEVCGGEWDAGFSQWIVDVPAMQDDVGALQDALILEAIQYGEKG